MNGSIFMYTEVALNMVNSLNNLTRAFFQASILRFICNLCLLLFFRCKNKSQNANHLHYSSSCSPGAYLYGPSSEKRQTPAEASPISDNL